MKTPDGTHDDLARKLLELEEAVSEPVFPGELSPWCATVKSALQPVWKAFRKALDHRNPLYEEVLQDDPALHAGVTPLRTEDRALEDELRRLERGLDHLLTYEERNPTASAEPEQRLNHHRKELLEWILRCRKQEVEVRAWLAEAYYRETGEVD